jgi:hypothetical protein
MHINGHFVSLSSAIRSKQQVTEHAKLCIEDAAMADAAMADGCDSVMMHRCGGCYMLRRCFAHVKLRSIGCLVYNTMAVMP